jgi:uncharacterized damage-inducible protein DinB
MNDAEAILARLPHHRAMLERNLQMLLRMVGGMDDAAADHAPIEGGSTLRWLLGHLLAYRDQMLRRLGGEPVWDETTAEPFKRGSRPEGGPPLADVVAALKTQGPRLAAAFAGADAATLAQPSTRASLGSLGAELEFGVWHDTYHIGQAALYRRAAGLDSPIG